MFKFSSRTDKCLVFFGIVCYMISGALSPIYAIAIGEVFEIFDPNVEVENRDELMARFTYWVGVLCLLMMIFNSLSYGILQSQAEKVSFELRSRYLETLMKQEVAYFEKINVQALPSEMAEHFYEISEGVGKSIGMLFSAATSIVVGLCIAYWKGRVLAGYVTLYTPLFFVVLCCFGAYLGKSTSIKL